MKKATKRATSLPPSDSKVYTRRKRVPTRSPDQVTLTVTLPRVLKESLYERNARTAHSVSHLVRWALAFHEKTGWKFIYRAMGEEEVKELQELGDKYPLNPKIYPEL